MKTYNLILVALFLFASAFTIRVKTYQLKGIVLAADNRQPVANAYLYIVKGEEEVLTNEKGEFTLTTGEKIPCAVTIIHKDFKPQKLSISNIDQPIKILLVRK